MTSEKETIKALIKRQEDLNNECESVLDYPLSFMLYETNSYWRGDDVDLEWWDEKPKSKDLDNADYQLDRITKMWSKHGYTFYSGIDCWGEQHVWMFDNDLQVPYDQD